MKKTTSEDSQYQISSTLNALEGSQVYVGNLQTARSINNIALPVIEDQLPAVWGTVPLENTNFYEFSITKIIHNAFEGNHSHKLVAITGLGGIGKTELAKNYFYHSTKNYNAKIWFNADSRNSLEREYHLLAIKLHLAGEEESMELIKRKIHAYLAGKPGWLLVLDNADNMQEIADLLPPSGGDILVSSRQAHWPEQNIRVKMLEESEAILFFKMLNNQKYENEVILAQLVRALGHLPLAIAQAAAYINQTPHINAEEYLKLFNENKKAFLSTNKLSPLSNNNDINRLTVLTTWNISLKEIQIKSPHIEKILNIIIFLNAKNIPIEFLEKYLNGKFTAIDSSMILHEIIGILISYSLMEVTDQLVSINSLLQTVITMQTPEDVQEEAFKIALDCLDKLFDYKVDPAVPEKLEIKKINNAFYDKYIFHIDTLLKQTNYLRLAPIAAHSLSVKFAHYTIEIKSNYKTAKLIVAQIEKLHETTHAEQSSNTKSELSKLKGCLSSALGHYTQASKEFLDAIKLSGKTPENENNDFYLNSLFCKLGFAYYFLGQYDEAREQFQNVLKHKKNGKPDYNTALAWCGMGNISQMQNKINDAESFYKASLRIIKTVFDDHPHKLIANLNQNLAIVYHRLKVYSRSQYHIFTHEDYSTALKYFTIAHEMYLKIYTNKRHIDIAILHYNTARLLFDMGKIDESMERIQQSLSIYNDIYGLSEHVDMVVIVFYLGFLKCRQGDYKSGLEKYKRAFQIYDKAHDNEDIGLKNLFNYIDFYMTKEEFAKAEECYFTIMRQRYPTLKKSGTRIFHVDTESNLDLYQDSETQDALITACFEGDASKATLLITDAYADPSIADSNGITPLYAAAQNGHFHIVKLLISIGKAKVNKRKNPIFIASKYGFFEIVDYLLNSITSKTLANKDPAVWQENTDFVMSFGCEGRYLYGCVKMMEDLVNGFFQKDNEIKTQSTEFMLNFIDDLLDGLDYLSNSKQQITPKIPIINEIILTLCTMDSEMITTFLNNSIRADNTLRKFSFRIDDSAPPPEVTYSEHPFKTLSLRFLKLIGISDDFVKKFAQNRPDPSETKEIVDNYMKTAFIFDLNAFANKAINTDNEHTSNSVTIFTEIKYMMVALSQFLSQSNIDAKKIKDLSKYLSYHNAIIRLATKNIIIKLDLLGNSEIIDALIVNCQHNNWRIRKESLVLLRMAIQLTPDINACLKNALADKITAVKTAAAITLIKFNYTNDKAVAILTENLSDFNSNIRYESLNSLTKIPSLEIPLIKHLVPLLLDFKKETRSLAEQCIKKILPDHKQYFFDAIIFIFSNEVHYQKSLRLLKQILTIDPDLKSDLLRNVICHNVVFKKLAGTIDHLELLLSIFSEYDKELLRQFQHDIINAPDFGISSLNSSIIFAKKFPDERDFLFSITINDPIWFVKYIQNAEDFSRLTNAFPQPVTENASLVAQQWNNIAQDRCSSVSLDAKLDMKFQ